MSWGWSSPTSRIIGVVCLDIFVKDKVLYFEDSKWPLLVFLIKKDCLYILFPRRIKVKTQLVFLFEPQSIILSPLFLWRSIIFINFLANLLHQCFGNDRLFLGVGPILALGFSMIDKGSCEVSCALNRGRIFLYIDRLISWPMMLRGYVFLRHFFWGLEQNKMPSFTCSSSGYLLYWMGNSRYDLRWRLHDY